MKATINGQEVNVKVTENLGFQGGYNAKAVEYKGEEYIIVKRSNGTWEQRTNRERLGYRE